MIKNTLKEIKKVFNTYGTSVLGILVSVSIILLALGGVAGIVLGIFWCFWQLWMFVMPQVFATAPEGFKYPGYWLFVSCVILFNWLRAIVFGSRISTKDKDAS